MRNDIYTSVDHTPGPGEYELRGQLQAKGGSSLANRSQRFVSRNEDVPGPGAYVIEPVKEGVSRTAPAAPASESRVLCCSVY